MGEEDRKNIEAIANKGVNETMLFSLLTDYFYHRSQSMSPEEALRETLWKPNLVEIVDPIPRGRL